MPDRSAPRPSHTAPSAPVDERCEWGHRACHAPAELDLTIPAVGDRRQLCCEHAGLFMLGATGMTRAGAMVVVRNLAADMLPRSRARRPIQRSHPLRA